MSSFKIGASISSDSVHMKEDELENKEIERSKVMRAIVEIQDPSAKDVDNSMICRFLRARDLDTDKASAMFLKYLYWRKEFVPNGFISLSEIQNDIAQNKLFMQGRDKTGSPILIALSGRHKPTSVEEFKRFVTYSLDKICARMPSGHEKFTAIADLQGWGYSNSDIRGYLAALSILQDFYPERLGKLFVIHVPYIFMTAWKAFCPFIDKNTKKKIIFVENKQVQLTLLQHIHESQLPERYGGQTTISSHSRMLICSFIVSLCRRCYSSIHQFSNFKLFLKILYDIVSIGLCLITFSDDL
ncbi:Sec14p-like phosphatidylinositol transfer family protein [Abeliophyllum distichum]|uniref:Sec14p-like phosphatidylinositol transfer family protein n=1 Tax=Abeliophyllum distichum TaxID=126358 RepID=A0ABD1W186_9LAMI